MRCCISIPELRPMAEFDPARPCLLHDQLNDVMVDWNADWREDWRLYAHPHAPGVIEWDGRLLDGWRPGQTAPPV